MYFTLFSNGKINLYLRVLYKREDHYHEIESIFAPLPIFDIITIKIKNFSDYAIQVEDCPIKTTNRIHINNKSLFEEVSERGDLTKNLIYQLLQILLEKNIKIPKMEIYLEKYIPPGSGVGGGSSNAGTILRFLTQQKIIDFSTALRIAEKIGSDVPFFLYNTISYVYGKGEKIKPLPFFFKYKFYGIICLNSFSISTKEAYQRLKRNHIKKPHIKLELLKNNYEQYAINEFEEVVYQMEPRLNEIKNLLLKTNPKKVLLTGSGSSIFSLYDNEKKMIESYELLKKMEGQTLEFRTFII